MMMPAPALAIWNLDLGFLSSLGFPHSPFAPQQIHWVHLRCASGWQPAGEQPHASELAWLFMGHALESSLFQNEKSSLHEIKGFDLLDQSVRRKFLSTLT